MLPFTTEEFFAVFAAMNMATWPVALLFEGLGLLAAGAIFFRPRRAGRVVSFILTVFWLWIGLVYHLIYFSDTNPAAYGFAALFVAQALIFATEGVWRRRIGFAIAPDFRTAGAAVLILYGLIAYPLMGLMGAHPYPATPLFGVAPCPTVIFTLGLLLLMQHPRPWLMAAIPLIWSAIGGTAAILLHVPQDWGLLAAASIFVLNLQIAK